MKDSSSVFGISGDRFRNRFRELGFVIRISGNGVDRSFCTRVWEPAFNEEAELITNN